LRFRFFSLYGVVLSFGSRAFSHLCL
jgi:hypothetical protein